MINRIFFTQTPDRYPNCELLYADVAIGTGNGRSWSMMASPMAAPTDKGEVIVQGLLMLLWCKTLKISDNHEWIVDEFWLKLTSGVSYFSYLRQGYEDALCNNDSKPPSQSGRKLNEAAMKYADALYSIGYACFSGAMSHSPAKRI